MRVGDLVRNVHDDGYHGIIIETAPIETRIDHGDNVCKVLWFDGDVSFEFLKVLEVLNGAGGFLPTARGIIEIMHMMRK